VGPTGYQGAQEAAGEPQKHHEDRNWNERMRKMETLYGGLMCQEAQGVR